MRVGFLSASILNVGCCACQNFICPHICMSVFCLSAFVPVSFLLLSANSAYLCRKIFVSFFDLSGILRRLFVVGYFESGIQGKSAFSTDYPKQRSLQELSLDNQWKKQRNRWISRIFVKFALKKAQIA